jgi:lysophospholipase L1-like esterase
MKATVVLVALGLVLTPGGRAQQSALLNVQAANQLFERTVQLMESTTVAVPGLVRAGAPVLENARQALITLQAAPGQNSALTYTFLSNARAYLALADSVPKPFPFPEQARQQFAELRESVDRIESHFRALLDQKEAQVRNPDRDNLSRYAEANQRLGPPDPNQPRVVFLGDSITDGWRLNEYFSGRDFVNRGISGQITGEMLGRMKADVIDLKPVAVLILAGTNDIARGVAIRTIQNNLTMIADLADYHKIKPLFASILPVSDYHKDKNPLFERTKLRQPAVIVNLNIWIRELCRQRGYTYVDYFSKMVDKAGYMQAELADDGLHPNSMGYRVMAPVALEAINRVAGEQKAGPQQRKKRLGVF